jgi:hypothetical protein
MNITTATPAEIDTRAATIMGRQGEIEHGLMRAQYILDSKYSTEAELDKAVETIKALNAERVELSTEMVSLNSEYIRRGTWTRYYLVLNSNGHVHTSTSCETCFEDTEFGWLTQFSGTDHDEMGKLSGMDACARCFPNLPAEVMQAKRDARVDTPERITAREEREAAAAKKSAKAAANSITDVDGTPLKDDDGYVIKTLRTAQVKAVQALEQAGLDEIYADQAEDDDPAHAVRLREMAKDELSYADRLIHAIAAKLGQELAFVADEFKGKADKKLAKARKDEAARKAAGKTAREWYTAR